jgi:hypothetical protein
MASAQIAAVAFVDTVSKTFDIEPFVAAQISSPTFGLRWTCQIRTLGYGIEICLRSRRRDQPLGLS